MKLILSLILMLFGLSGLQAQRLRGVVSDTEGNPVPFATIFIKEEAMGTTSNGEGKFDFLLGNGNYTIQFRSMGFQELEQQVLINDSVVWLDVVLVNQTFEILEIFVFNSDEDPAVPIMRRAIALAPFYQNQVDSYRASVYLKGMFKLDKVPGMFNKNLGIQINNLSLRGSGDAYVEESSSEIEFAAPNNYHQRIISTTAPKDSISRGTFDLGLITSSIYEPTISDGVIMPLSPNAFKYYNFTYSRCFKSGDFLINQIAIKPKRKGTQFVTGDIYVVDGLWNIYAADLKIDQRVAEVDVSIRMAEVSNKIFLPVSHTIKVNAGAMGIKAHGTYVSSIKYINFHVDENLQYPEVIKDYFLVKEERVDTSSDNPIDQLLGDLANEKELTRREVFKSAKRLRKLIEEQKTDSIAKSSLEKVENYKVEKMDTSIGFSNEFWEAYRPLPLTNEEVHSYELNDSIRLERLAKTESDTIKKSNKLATYLLMGKRWPYNNDSLVFGISPLLNFSDFYFNSVEGFHCGQNIFVTKKLSNERVIEADLGASYSFALGKLNSVFRTNYSYSPRHMGVLRFVMGDDIVDFASNENATMFLNTFASLLFKTNYSRFYNKQYIGVSNQIEIANGLQWYINASIEKRSNLENHSGFSFFARNDEYRSNGVWNDSGSAISAFNDDIAKVTVRFEYTPQMHYRYRGHAKVYEGSKWPTFNLSIKAGVDDFSDLNSTWLNINPEIHQKIKVNILNELSYKMSYSVFLNSEKLNAPDYLFVHTIASPIEFRKAEFAFSGLPYYATFMQGSTLTAAVNYKTPALLIKHLPYIDQFGFNENVRLRYLNADGFSHFEVGYGLSELFYGASLGVNYFQNSNQISGFSFRLQFDF